MPSSRHSFRAAWRTFFEPQPRWQFIIGALALGVSCGLLTECVIEWCQHDVWRMAGGGVGLLLVFGLMVWFLAKRMLRSQSVSHIERRCPVKRRGLIFMVGKSAAARAAVAYHQERLERCWLLCSPETEATAKELYTEFRDDGLVVAVPDSIDDVHDPLAFRDAVNAVYASLPEGWTSDDVIADYTGMTKHASVGMVLACLDGSRPLQYTPQDPTRASQSLDPMEIQITWELAGVQPIVAEDREDDAEPSAEGLAADA